MKKILFALLTVLSVFLVLGCVQVQSSTSLTTVTTTTQLRRQEVLKVVL